MGTTPASEARSLAQKVQPPKSAPLMQPAAIKPNRPSVGGPKPSVGAPKLSVGGPKPKPSVGGPKPSVGGPKLSVGGPKPSMGGPKPSVGGPKPSVGGPKPSVGGSKSSTGRSKPVLGGPSKAPAPAAVPKMAAVVDQAMDAALKHKPAPAKSAPSTPSEKKTKPKQPTTPGSKSSAWGTLTGWVTKKLNPDATVAKEGLKMEAYFDKEKGRWIIPGEEAAEEDEAPAAPPTSMSEVQKPA